MTSYIPTNDRNHIQIEVDEEDEDEDLVSIPATTAFINNSNNKGKGKEPLLGKIGSTTGTGTTTASIGDRATARYTGTDTLDEAVSVTIMRDLNAIGIKIVQVLNPTGQHEVLRDWDLWGPLIFCLALAVLLSMNAPTDQSLPIFTGVFVIVWLGSVIITLNAKLLGGKVSFLQSLCVLGYCIFPLDIAAVVAAFVRVLWIRIPVCSAAFAWSVWAAVNFLGGTRLEKDRAVLAVFPLFMLFFLLAWMTMLS